MSTLVGHFVSSPREREKRDRRGSRDETEGQGRKRKMNESEKTIHPLPLSAARIAVLPDCKPIYVGHPSDIRYMTPLPYPTTPYIINKSQEWKIKICTDQKIWHSRGHTTRMVERRSTIIVSIRNGPSSTEEKAPLRSPRQRVTLIS